MARVDSTNLIPVSLLAVFSCAASASGFQLTEQNVSGIGNAYAGQAAVAEDASTIFYNPAGMTQLRDRELSAGVAAIGPSFKFNNQGSRVGALNTAGDGGDAGGWAGVPNGYLSWALNKDLYFGVGFGAPFGLKTEYDNPWIGAAQSTSFEVKTCNVNPSIAYRVNEMVSLGLGVNWQHVEATYERQVGVAAASLAASPLKLTLDDDAWGWNAGALFTISPSTRVGVSYRSAIQYHTTGKIEVSGPSATINNGASSDAKADLKMPDIFSLALTQQLSDKWQMLGDVTWTGWSSIPKVDVLRASSTSLYVPGLVGQPAGTTAQVLDTDFRDTWRVGLGLTYQYNDAWKVKYGIAYDQTPVKGASTRLVSLPDNDRVWFSFGTQWAVDKASRLDLGVSYIYIRDSDINNDQTTGYGAGARGTVVGEYTGNIWLFGAQYSMAF